MLSRLNIAQRIHLLLILAALGMLVCSAIGLWTLREQMLQDRRVQLSYIMDVVLQDARANMKAAGGPETESGRKAFLDVLRAARFGDRRYNYFFAYDYNGVAILHPNPKKIGLNLSNEIYGNDLKMLPIFIGIAKSADGFGFAEYPFPKDVEKPRVTPKLSFVQNVPELNIFIAVGVYIEEVYAIFFERIRMEAWLFLITLPAFVLIGYLINRSITRPLRTLAGEIARLARGDLKPSSALPAENTEIGEVTGAVDVLRANAIEQQALQQKLREQTLLAIEEKERSEQAVKAKGEFLSNMSHELRTPMHAILGYAEIGITAIDECNCQDNRKYLINIQRSGKRLLKLLNDLLALAKMNAGKIDYKREPGDLADVVEHTLIELDPLIKGKNLTIRRELLHAEAVFDKPHMIQVLVNLVSNAIKFSSEGSQICVEIFGEAAGGRRAGPSLQGYR